MTDFDLWEIELDDSWPVDLLVYIQLPSAGKPYDWQGEA